MRQTLSTLVRRANGKNPKGFLNFDLRPTNGGGRRPPLQQCELLTAGAAEVRRGEFVAALGEANFAAGNVEQLIDLVGEDAFPAHAGAELGAVEFTAAHAAQAVEDFVFAVRKVRLQPLLE